MSPWRHGARARLAAAALAMSLPAAAEAPGSELGVGAAWTATRLAMAATRALQDLATGVPTGTTASVPCPTAGQLEVTRRPGPAPGTVVEALRAQGCVKHEAYVLDGEVELRYRTETSGLARGEVRSTVALSGRLSILTFDELGGVDQRARLGFDGLRWTLGARTVSTPEGPCFALTADAAGRLWVGSRAFSPGPEDVTQAWEAVQAEATRLCPLPPSTP